MFKNVFFTIIVLHIVLNSNCQVINIDSLFKVTYSNLAENTQTAERYEAIASYYWRVNPDSSLIFANKLMNLGNKLNNLEIKSNANILLGNLLLDKNDLKEARQLYDIALLNLKDKSKILKVFSNYGVSYLNENDYKNAEIWLNKGLKIAYELKDLKSEAFIINNLGIISDETGQKEQAIQNYLKAGKIFESLGELGRLGVMYHNIGSVYSNLKEQQKAIQFTKKAVECYLSVKNYKSLNNANLNLVYYYNEVDSIDKAEQLIQEFTNPKFPMNSSQNALLLLLKGQILEKKKQYNLAVDTLIKCYHVANEANSPINVHNACATLLRIYNKIGEFNKGIKYGEEAFSIALKMNDPISINVCQELLSKAYFGLGNYQKAYNLLYDFDLGRDTIYKKEKIETIHTIETKYETEKKDMLIAQHQKDDIAKRKIIGLLMALLVLSIGAVVLYRKRNEEKVKVNALLSAQNQVLQSNNLELSAELENIRLKKTEKPLEELFVTLRGNGKEIIKLTDITHIEADGNSVEIFTKDNKKYYDWQKIKHYKELLEPSGLFLQTHRSYLINYQYITAKKANEITLNHSIIIPIGNTLKDNVHQWLKEKLG